MTATEVSEVEALAEAAGYTVPRARARLRSRLWRSRVWVVCGVLAVILIVAAFLRPPPHPEVALSTFTTKADGAMAVAEILRDNGVSVREVAYLSHARITDPTATTLVVTLPSGLTQTQLDSVLAYPGDVVFIGVSNDLVNTIGGLTIQPHDNGTVRTAKCADDDAQAAERLASEGQTISIKSWDEAQVCFTDANGNGNYVIVTRNGHTLRLITDPYLAMNGHLTENGNAALLLRATGHHANLVWYVGAPDDTTHVTYPGAPAGPGEHPSDPIQEETTSSSDLLPPGTTQAIFALAMAAFVAAIWRARRMGALVGESLPVIVHSSESTRGRGRMYHRARAYGRASAALRAAAAERMGRRLGIARSANAVDLISAVARASGREAVGVERLIFGSPPESEAAMMDLAKELDALEREVHRP